MISDVSKAYAKKLVDSHDKFLQNNLEIGSYNKLYSFKHIVNGFAVHTTASQVTLIHSTIQNPLQKTKFHTSFYMNFRQRSSKKLKKQSW